MADETGSMLSTVTEQKTQAETEIQSGMDTVCNMMSEHTEKSVSQITEVRNPLT